MAIHTHGNKQSANAEVHSTTVHSNINHGFDKYPTVLSPSSPLLLKASTKTQMPSKDVTYIQHQIDRLRQEMENNAAENKEFKNLINKI